MMGVLMPKKFETLFGWGVAIIIVGAIIGGLMMVGGPSKARDQKIDNKRLQSMQMNARAISCYADNNDGAPQSLKPVERSVKDGDMLHLKKQRCRNLKWETDPVTETDFEYNRLGPQSFELCGIFAREGSKTSSYRGANYNANRVNILRTKISRTVGGRHCYNAKNWTEKKS